MNKPLAILVALGLAGAASAEGITVDNCGKPLVFDATPERVVVHDMNMTEMAFALGLRTRSSG